MCYTPRLLLLLFVVVVVVAAVLIEILSLKHTYSETENKF